MNRFESFFLPKEVDSMPMHEAASFRFMTYSYLVIGLVLAIMIPVNLYFDDYSILPINLFTAGMVVTGFCLLRFKRALKLTTVVLLTMGFVSLGAIVYNKGFLNHPETGWYLLFPIVGTMILGAKAGWFITFFALLNVSLLTQFTSIAVLDEAGRNMEVTPAFVFGVFSLKLLFIMLLAQIYESLQISYIENLEKEKSKLETTQFLLNETNSIANIGGWSLNVKSGEIWWSEQVYRILDLPVTASLSLQDLYGRCRGEHKEILRKALDKAVQGGVDWSLELPVQTAKGEHKWVHWVGKVSQDAVLNTVLRGTLQDVTAKYLATKKIKEARDSALAAATSRDRFLANMSHEIRTPLNGIIGNIDLLMEKIKDPEALEIAQTMSGSSETLLNIINDILEISAIDAGKLKIRKRSFGLQDCISNCLRSLDWLAKEKGLATTLVMDPGLPEWVLGDDIRINQVLLNLVGNALKFTVEGSVKVLVSPAEESDHVQFEVVDTGIGISRDDLKDLFSRFSQVDDQKNREFEGTGLGLTISRNLVELMGGTLSVESQPGVGSRFIVQLPLERTEPSVKRIQNRTEALASNSHRVLVVDDNPVNRKLATAFLISAGFRVDQASDGNEGVDLALRNTYSIILMDIHMPGIDGLEASKQILEQKPGQIILALTASAMEKERIKYLEAGLFAVLAKPIRKKKLLDEVRRFIDAA